MNPEIVIVYAYLETLSSTARGAVALLESTAPGTTLSFPGSPPVDDVMGDFMGEWDERRADINESVLALANTFDFINSSFQAVETALVGVLYGPPAP